MWPCSAKFVAHSSKVFREGHSSPQSNLHDFKSAHRNHMKHIFCLFGGQQISNHQGQQHFVWVCQRVTNQLMGLQYNNTLCTHHNPANTS